MEMDWTDSRQERQDDAFDDDEHGVKKSIRYRANSSSSSSRDKDRRRREEKEVRDRDHHHHHHRSNKERNRSNTEKEKEKEKKDRPKEKEREREREKERVKEKTSKKAHEEEDYDRRRGRADEDDGEGDFGKEGKVSFRDEDEKFADKKEDALGGERLSTQEFEQRISEMKESRTKKSEGGSEISAWVSRSRKIEKEKVKQLSKIFEEQDNVGQEDIEDVEGGDPISHNLGGVKVLHGLDKVMEGGAVVLTFKDQGILAGGDLNEDVDMLENVEIGEQKCRDEAYKAAKKKSAYDDMFNEDPASEKKILPQYDDSTVDEGVTLDARGRVSVEAEKKLEELRRRLQGTSGKSRFEDLNSSGKISSDYYTQEEMLQFKKPKKKKAIRKREKLDIDALEAEAVSAGLGVGDLGSRGDARRQSIREEQERAEAEMRKSAYASAYAKADEASKSLLLEQIIPAKIEEDELFADDQEDLFKSLERARKLALKKQGDEALGPEAIAQLAISKVSSQVADDQNNANGESQENKVVFTEMEEFVWGLQLNQEAHKPETEDVFMDEDEAPIASAEDMKFEAGGWTEVEESPKDENHIDKDKEEIVPDETIHEAPVGKGLSGTLKLLKDRGELKETVDWGGRNMDKKKSKLVGIVDDGNNKFKDIRIERTDEFGRIMTPKEAFRVISHKFHGKGPGKMKQEKRMKQHQEEMKLKQMKNSDTPSLSVERMREAQAQLKTPYLVLSGHVKPGQSSDPKSGFTTVEKDLPGDLTPMLGDRKVEHFLGIKRKAEPGNSNIPKKPKT